MRVLALALLPGGFAAQGAWLIADPQVITSCIPPGLGATTLSWDSEGIAPVEIRINGVDGPSMTGPAPATGMARTGDWVGEETFFSLVDSNGIELARAEPRLACGGRPGLPPEFSGTSFFPLQVGNQWVYQVSDRSATSFYVTRQVTGMAEVDGVAYYVVEQPHRAVVDAQLYRTDEDGNVYMRTASTPERLWLDPTGMRNEEALLEVTATDVRHSSQVGVLDGAVRYHRSDGNLIQANGVIAPGVGLVDEESQLIAGSSGGFFERRELVYANIGGAIVLTAPELGFTLAAEDSVLRVTERQVTNCVIPCYFTACGLVPPVEDPPGTYKPCFRSRITVRNTTNAPVRLTLPTSQLNEIELEDVHGSVVYRNSDRFVFEPVLREVVFPPGETHYFEQVPLYSEPNVPFPPGRYRLRATIDAVDGPGFDASVDLTIE